MNICDGKSTSAGRRTLRFKDLVVGDVFRLAQGDAIRMKTAKGAIVLAHPLDFYPIGEDARDAWPDAPVIRYPNACICLGEGESEVSA